MKLHLRTILALGLGIFIMASVQQASATTVDQKRDVIHTLRTQNMAKRHVISLIKSPQNSEFVCGAPQKIGIKRAFALRSSVGIFSALKLARSFLVPVYQNHKSVYPIQNNSKEPHIAQYSPQRNTKGTVIGVVILPRGTEQREVLGTVSRPLKIEAISQMYPQNGDPATMLNKNLAGPATGGEGLTHGKSAMKLLGDMIPSI